MGVTLEGFAEVRSKGRWTLAGWTVPNPLHRFDPDEPRRMPEPIFESDQKELAAILMDTGRPIRSAEPYAGLVPRRGTPADVSPDLAAWLTRPTADESASITWFTASEARAFDWSRFVRRRAYVPREAAHLFGGCPRGFPWDTWPPAIPVRIAEWSRDGEQVEWLESYEQVVSWFVHRILPRLDALGPHDDVRMIVTANW